MPTGESINGYSAGAIDPDYESLYFQYGRYLLISSARPGGTAANLQVIWNNELRPPRSSNYTININRAMNYRTATSFLRKVTGNLPEGFICPKISFASSIPKKV